jgi:hypothetical protein
LINPIRNLCSRNDELKRYLHLEGIALHVLGDAGVDAGSLPLDTPLSALGEFTGVQGNARWAAEASGSAEPTIRDLAIVLEGQTGSSVRRTRSPATSRSGARPASMASTSITQRVLAPSGRWPTVCFQHCGSGD